MTHGTNQERKTVGGWPQLETLPAPADSMPDEWELQYKLDPQNPADGSLDHDKDGYPNLEEFLNGTDPTGASSSTISERHVTTPYRDTNSHG